MCFQAKSNVPILSIEQEVQNHTEKPSGTSCRVTFRNSTTYTNTYIISTYIYIRVYAIYAVYAIHLFYLMYGYVSVALSISLSPSSPSIHLQRMRVWQLYARVFVFVVVSVLVWYHPHVESLVG